MTPQPRPSQDDNHGEALDSAVQKLEAREAKTGSDPVPSVGREIRDGYAENA